MYTLGSYLSQPRSPHYCTGSKALRFEVATGLALELRILASLYRSG